MRCRCPSCHAEFALEQATENDAARELMAILADLPAECGRPLTGYLGLFRPRSRALGWERALRLARECLTMHADPLLLGAALSETVQALRAKQDPERRPLGNHNYLKRVLETVASRPQQLVTGPETTRAVPVSATRQAVERLTTRRGSRDG